MGAHTIGGAQKGYGQNRYRTPGQQNVYNTNFYEAMVDPALKWKNMVCTL